MSNDTIVALTFLVLPVIFMVSLFMALFKIIGVKKTKENFSGGMVLKVFWIPITTFLALMVFVLVVLPNMG